MYYVTVYSLFQLTFLIIPIVNTLCGTQDHSEEHYNCNFMPTNLAKYT